MFKMIEGPTLPLYARYILATVFVVWFSLAGGSWLGRALVHHEVFGEADEQVEFRSMPEPRARPWVKVDPELEKELEILRSTAGPSLVESLSQKTQPRAEDDASKKDVPTVVATPEVGQALVSEGTFLLQFGAFSESANAERLKEQLVAQGQTAQVERVESASGVPLYRVKGPVFEDSQTAERQARTLRAQGFQVFVVGE